MNRFLLIYFILCIIHMSFQAENMRWPSAKLGLFPVCPISLGLSTLQNNPLLLSLKGCCATEHLFHCPYCPDRFLCLSSLPHCNGRSDLLCHIRLPHRDGHNRKTHLQRNSHHGNLHPCTTIANRGNLNTTGGLLDANQKKHAALA